MLAPVTMHKAEKYAVRKAALDETQRAFFMQNFGCTRKVYNLYTDFLYTELERLGYTCGILPDIRFPEVSVFKAKYDYLKDTDSLGLANAKIAFLSAVKRFNEGCDHVTYRKGAVRRADTGGDPLTFRDLKGMPRFHARAHGNFSYTTNCQYPGDGNSLARPTIRLEGDILYLPKLKGGVRLVVHRPLPDSAVIRNVTISMDPDGTIYASIGYEYTAMIEMSLREAALAGDNSILDKLTFLGLDYSQGDFYVDSEGRKANCPHSYRKSEEKLARLQRELSRMRQGSKNYDRQLLEIQRLHAKIRNQRRDFVNKEAAYLAGSYDVIAVEDINLRAMAGSLSLGRNLHDNGFGMFRDRLARKLEEKGSILVRVDRWFPSTKTCSSCGYVNPDVTLGVSEWVCPICGAVHQRDENAAVNIREEAKRIFLEQLHAWIEENHKARTRASALSAARKRKRSAA